MKEEERAKLKSDLENYCNDVIEKYQSGENWAFGAIDFARYAGLVSLEDTLELDNKTWNRRAG